MANLSGVVLRADLVLDHGICLVSYLTVEYTCNIDLLLLDNLALHFALSGACVQPHSLSTTVCISIASLPH